MKTIPRARQDQLTKATKQPFLLSVVFLLMAFCSIQISYAAEKQASPGALEKNKAVQQAVKAIPPDLSEGKTPGALSFFNVFKNDAETELTPQTLQQLQLIETELDTQPLTASISKKEAFFIDMQTVLALIQAQNLAVQSGKLTEDQAKNQFHQSLSRMLLPDFIGSYDHSRFQGAIQVFGSQTVTIFQTSVVPQLTASWQINPGGQDLFTALANRQRIKSSQFSLEESLQDQWTSAANEYLALISSALLIESAKLAVDEAEREVALNQAKMDAGVGIKIDLLRAKADLLLQEQTLMEASTQRNKAEQDLFQRLNLDNTIRLTVSKKDTDPKVLLALDMPEKTLLKLAIENSPKVKKLDREVLALKHEVKAVLGRLVPSVNLQTYINGTGPAFDALGLSRFGGFRVETRLFEQSGLAIPLAYHEKKLALKQKQLEHQQALLALKAAVINAHNESMLAAKTIFKTQEAVAVNQEAYQLATGRYKAGVGIQLDVIDSHLALITARTDLIKAILSFNQSQIKLLNAVGMVSPNTLINGVDPNAIAL
ncbi:MAG: TolC family protein [Cyanobacteria bacterium P01_H01_bin.74]